MNSAKHLTTCLLCRQQCGPSIQPVQASRFAVLRSFGKDQGKNPQRALYIHIGPSGDCWTSHSTISGKHLQPGYVRSVPLGAPFVDCEDDTLVDVLLKTIEGNKTLQKQIYDEERVPTEILDQILVKYNNKNGS